jgi:hypothetical protein
MVMLVVEQQSNTTVMPVKRRSLERCCLEPHSHHATALRSVVEAVVALIKIQLLMVSPAQLLLVEVLRGQPQHHRS